jgi:hypothetical protein
MILVLVACTTAVKHEGFKASISAATDPGIVGRFVAVGAPSCARVSADLAEVRLVAERFELTVIEAPRGRARTAVLVVDGETYRSDRQGAETHLVVDDVGGRFIGSMTGTLVHESAGTLAAGRSAPVRDLSLDLTFNVQLCL